METLTIEIDSTEDKELLVSILPRFNARLKKPNGKPSLLDIANKIAASGGVSSFGDASEWQREIRSWDRVLDGREE